MNTWDTIGTVILAGMISYSFVLFYHILKEWIHPDPNRPRIKHLYYRMFVFAIIGFAVFFAAEWLYLEQIGAFEWGWNPYTGPPPMMRCLLIGSFGLTVGALIGLFTKRSKQNKLK